jgi:hypothetical protein
MDTADTDSSEGGEGRTTAQMTYPYADTTYVGWDFTTVWAVDTDGRNQGYPYLGVSAAATTWDAGYTDLGGGWRRLSWFGDYVPMGGAGWIWHNMHGFFFVPASSTPQHVWLYAQDMGWLYTGDTIYPFLFRASDGAWLWYNGSTNPRWFVNMGTGQWESHY